ncbi:type I-C CRISPR-associated protein Cas7/Csd2 [Streptomyces sp. NBC_01443]|uniref:type I-C CRISPR-associated protein Cas7/Csd2 n=1 Tax=Streptomyces sp. NBC_01443 TaxID=2903868 RepID=UPI00224E980A|nr:type I-C CRISPR-associated protein Cas7/Csd2 [Streptomyces sp. NBC_01443]MCX4626264.1 type I-C CRISPR-associated protein Cas7/Csd2 [Streptomyces sp. NBC_01443]
MTQAHLDPTRKHDFVFLIDATDSNPNGDPDNGGIPRTDPVTGQGLIADVAIKRKIRNTIALINRDENKPGYEVYVEAGVALNAQHERAYTPENGATNQSEARTWMCRNFFDVRMFGAVMSTGKRDKTAGRVQGPMQISFSRSIDPITPFDIGVTRVTPTKQEDIDAWHNPEEGKKGKESEMGSKHIVPYGLYRGAGHSSAPLAAKTGVTSEDLAAFWRAFTSCSTTTGPQPEAPSHCADVFTHDDAFGRAPAHTLLDRIHIKPLGDVSARSFTDYGTVEIRDTDLPAGITLTRLIG